MIRIVIVKPEMREDMNAPTNEFMNCLACGLVVEDVAEHEAAEHDFYVETVEEAGWYYTISFGTRALRLPYLEKLIQDGLAS